jgi:hypothetical protein
VHLLEAVPTTGYDYEHRHDLMRVVWTRMAGLLRDRYDIDSSPPDQRMSGGTEGRDSASA